MENYLVASKQIDSGVVHESGLFSSWYAGFLLEARQKDSKR